MRSIRTNAGFSLVEVLIALVISGTIAITAGGLIHGLISANERIHRVSTEADRTANAERLLRELVGQIEPDSAYGGIWGGGSSVRMATWCRTYMGWQERCDAELALKPDGSTWALIAIVAGKDSLTLSHGIEHAQFAYLVSAAAGGIWVTSWPYGITVPLALGVIVDGDTSILRIGERT